MRVNLKPLPYLSCCELYRYTVASRREIESPTATTIHSQRQSPESSFVSFVEASASSISLDVGSVLNEIMSKLQNAEHGSKQFR